MALTEAQEKGLAKVERWAKEHPGDQFEARDVGVQPAVLDGLLYADFLEKGEWTSSRHTYYRLTGKERLVAEEYAPQDVRVDDLFRGIQLYDDVKSWVRRTIAGHARVHHGFFGPPASGKTMLMSEVASLRGAEMVVGSSATRAGLTNLLLEKEPQYLCVDEIDKLDRQDMAALLSLCENGFVTKVTAQVRVAKNLSTIVFVSGNNLERLSPEVRSRFMIWRFKAYSEEEFVAIATAVLSEREWLPGDVARYIAIACWRSNERYVRDEVRAARMTRTGGPPDQGLIDDYFKARQQYS